MKISSQKISQLLFTIAACCLGLFLTVPTTFAATHTWIGGSPLGPNWSVPANWTNGVPSTGDDLVFPSSARADHTNINNLIGSPQFNSISFTGLLFPKTATTLVATPSR